MESSRRAVESYWRSRMIDTATADDDKITPIYRLDEICDTIRSSPIGIVKEMSEFIFKRLDHKSPRVKQKALRLIKYSVAKAGVEFKREMQRHSGAIRQLFHYRGEPDALRGDSLNKAVRDTAHEAVTAIFASDEKQTTAEDINKRIQGFGNTNFEMPLDDRKSFLSEVVGFGSASIKQGLSMIGGQSSGYLDGQNNSAGSYKGPSLRKSLTSERDTFARHQREEPWTEPQFSASEHRELPSNQDYTVLTSNVSSNSSGSNQTRGNGREERLLDTITAAGGVRLQPSRETIQNFLAMASKLDSTSLSQALNVKIQSHVWQVRFKAMCVLESVLRQRDNTFFETVGAFFHENKDAIVNCTESPQTSLREKANRVLGLLGGSTAVNDNTTVTEKLNDKTTAKPVSVEMPDLIDTSEMDLLAGGGVSQAKDTDTLTKSATVDLLGDEFLPTRDEGNIVNIEEDPFVGLAIHTEGAEGNASANNLFSGLVLGNSSEMENVDTGTSNKDNGNFFSDFAQNIEQSNSKPSVQSDSLDDIFGSLSINQSLSESYQQTVNSGNATSNYPGTGFQFLQQNHPTVYQALDSLPSSQMMGANSSPLPSVSTMYNMPPNMVMHQMFPLQATNFGPIGNSLAQQQLLAAMANLQRLTMGVGSETTGFFGTDSGMGNGLAPSYSDGFDFTGDPTPNRVSTTESSRKEEKTRAFDFIADHISAVKNTKKVT